MNRYTLLLVDDEEEVIQIIIRKIDWDGLGFSVVGHAGNGVKALELVEDYRRVDCAKQVIDAGFDIQSTADWLQEFYLERTKHAMKGILK